MSDVHDPSKLTRFSVQTLRCAPHLKEPAVVGPLLAHQDGIDRGLHVVVDPSGERTVSDALSARRFSARDTGMCQFPSERR